MRTNRRAVRRLPKRFRRAAFELLEDRRLLSHTPASISAAEQQILEKGLDGLVTWSETLDEFDLVAQGLPVMGYSLGASLDLSDALDQGLVQPVHDFFAADPTPTSDELVGKLQTLDATYGNLQISVDPVSVVGGLSDPAGDQLLFELDFQATRTLTVGLSLGRRGEEMSLKFDSATTVDLVETLVFNFTFGVDLTPGLTDEEAFFIRVDEFDLTANVATASPTGDMVVGFYDARVTGSTVSLNAVLDVILSNPDGDPENNITLEELEDTDLDALVTLTPTGTSSGNLTAEADPFGGFTPGSSLNVSFHTTTPFDPPELTFSNDFDELLNYTNVNAYSVLGVMRQLGSFLEHSLETSVFDTSLQLAGDTRIGDAVDLGGVIDNEDWGLIGGLTADPQPGQGDSRQPKFDSAQSLADELMTALGLTAGQLQATYDEGTNDLTYHLVLSEQLAAQPDVPFGPQADLSPLASLASTDTVTVTPTASLDFVFGINLEKPVAVLSADEASPADGRLAANAHFTLEVGGQDPVAVTVWQVDTALNNDLADLATDFNAALLAAGLDDDVEAIVSGDRLALATKGAGVAAMVRIAADEGDPILTEVHFRDGKFAADSVTQHTFFETASIGVSANVAAVNVDATAEFGFLGIEVTDGHGSATVSVDLELQDPATGTPGGRVYLTELFDGLAEDISQVAGGPTVSGSVDLTLPMHVTPDILGASHPLNPRLELSWPDITDSNTLDVQVLDADLLEDFTHLDTTTVLTALASLASYVSDLEGYSFLDQKIPGVDLSVAEIADYAEHFLQLVATLEQDPGAVLQEVEEKIEQAFGLEEQLVDLSLVENNSVIRIDVTLEKTVDTQLPFNLDLEQLGHSNLGNLFDISASGQLAAAAKAVFELDLGIDISDPVSPRPFLYESSYLGMGVRIDGVDLSFTTAFGPLGIWVKQGRLLVDGDGDPDTSDDVLGVAVLLEGGDASDRIYLSDLGLDDAQLSLGGQVNARLPIYFPTENAHLGDVLLAITNVADIENSTTLVMPDFESVFGNFDLLNNLGGVIDGFDYVLTGIQDVLSSEVFSTSWPMIGDGMQDAADFIGDIRTDVIQKLRDRFGENFDHTSTFVREALYEALGPTGLDWLYDLDQAGGVTSDDIVTTEFDLDADGEADDQVEWSMWLNQQTTLVDTPIDFDIGVPSLGLDVDANIRLELGFLWKLTFGINRDDYFYFGTEQQDELIVYLRATTPGLEARGDLFFFQLDVKDRILGDGTGSRFVADVSLDLKDPNHDDKLTLQELYDLISGQYSFAEVFDPGIAGRADVALDLTVSYEGDARFPSLRSQFDLGWEFSEQTGLDGDVPTVSFDNVQLNLGHFISDFADDILKDVREVTEPLQPIVDFLTDPLPVLSDLGMSVSPLDIAELVGYGEAADFVEAVANVVTLINHVPIVGDDLYVPLGSFDLGGADIRQEDDLNGVSPEPKGPSENVRDNIQQASSTAGDFYTEMDNSGISFPLIDNPTNAFRLLLGQDVDLFLFDLPDLVFRLSFPVFKVGPLGGLPVFISVGDFFAAEADLKFGYDTSGLRTYLETDDPWDIFSGFFISDRENADGTGPDVPEGTLSGGIDVGLEAGIAVLAAGISGGIYTNLYADLIDPDNDGKVHLDEFLANLDIGLTSTFDVSGDIRAVFKAYVELAFIRYSYTFADLTIAKFELTDDEIYKDRFAAPGGGGGGGGGGLPPADDIRTLGVGPGLHVDGLGLSSDTDVDWYEFELLRGDSIDVDVRHNYVHGDLNLEMYDGQGTLLGSSFTDHDREVVSLLDVEAGKYYVRVAGQRNNYMVAVEPNADSDTRVIYVNPAGKEDRSDSYYTTAPGDDKWSGLVYRKPKATLASVLTELDLGPDDLVVCDTGSHAAGVVIAEPDEGATYVGTVAGSRLSGVVLRDSDDSLFHNLIFNGGGTGVHLEGDGLDDANDNTIRQCVFEDVSVSIQVDSSQPNLIEQNEFVIVDGASPATGVFISAGATCTVRNNEIAGRVTGIYCDSRVAEVYENQVHHNTVGMSSRRGVLGPDNPAPYGSPGGLPVNVLHDNTTGIYIPSDATGVLVRFNDIYDSVEVGIEQQGQATLIVANDVHENPIGIRGVDVIGPENWEAELQNLIHLNGTGVVAEAGSEVRYNRVFENGVGIRIEGDTQVHHNLIYRNGGPAILVDEAERVDILNNTMYCPGGEGVRLQGFSSDVTVQNNIVWTESGHGLYVDADSQFGYTSDYNNYYASGSGKVAFQGKDFDDLYDWRVEAEMDLHSIGRTDPNPMRDDPGFVDLSGNDFHLTAGSTSIDAGHPLSDYSREPGPSGGRINLGAYGNTPGATTSPTSWLRIAEPDFYRDLVPSRTYEIRWETHNVPGSDFVDIDLVEVGGGVQRWDVATALVSDGSAQWTPGAFVTGDTNRRYRIELATSGGTTLTASSREPFSVPDIVPANAQTFYVNDQSTDDDEYTSAIGDNRHTGTTAGDPKVVIRPLVLSYAMDTGDELRVDTGDYVHAVNLNLSGSPMAFDPRMNTVQHTRISGPTDVSRTAFVDRANPYQGAKAFDVIASDDMQLRHLTVTGAWTGVHVRLGSDNLVGEHLTLFEHSEDGMTVEGQSDGGTLDYLTVYDNGRHGILVDSLLVRVTDSQIYDNEQIGLALRSVGSCLVETSDVYGNRTGIDIINPGTARAVVGHADLTQFRGNLVHENDLDGIFASGNIHVAGNTVSENGRIGIHLDDGADAELNVVRQHVTGISALGSESQIIENRSYENSHNGIEASYGSYVHRNVTYSNGNKGIYVTHYSGMMDHNLVYNTGSNSIHVAGPGTAAELINNTVYEPCAAGEFEPPEGKTTIEVPWVWPIEMEEWETGQIHAITLVGTAQIEFGEPVGPGGETFDLGRGGGVDATIPELVPPGLDWIIPTQIVALDLRSLTPLDDGPFFAQLDPRMASTGTMTVENAGEVLVGESTLDIFVEFVFPQSELMLTSRPLMPAQSRTSFDFSSGVMPDEVLQMAIPLTPVDPNPIPLVPPWAGPDDPPWGGWYFAGGDQGPAPQHSGDCCAEIGVLVSDNSAHTLLRNNLVYVAGSSAPPPGSPGGRVVVVTHDSTTGWQSDFNVLTTLYGSIGEWAGQNTTFLTQWQSASGDDDFSNDPHPDTLWVDPDGADNFLGFQAADATDGRDDNLHLRSPFGEVDQGALAPVEEVAGASPSGLPVMQPVTWQDDAMPDEKLLSPAVDAGDPSYDFTVEPAFNGIEPGDNGQMINVGAYGNTAQASKSEPYYIHLVYPLGYEELLAGRTYDIQWRSRIPTSPPGVGLLIELRHGHQDGPAEVPSITAAAPDTGSFLWNVPSPPAPVPGNATDYWVRVTWEGDMANPLDDVAGANRRRLTLDADGVLPDDTIPPVTIDALPRVVRYEQRTNDTSISQITLVFSENLDKTDAENGANYRFDAAGYSCLPTYAGGNTDDDPSRVTLDIAGPTVPLPEGDYELTVAGNGIHDTGGVGLDGDGDGTAGGDYVRQFTVDFTPPTVSIPTIASHPSSGGLGQLSIVFSEAILGFGLADLRLTRDNGYNLLTGEQTLTSADGVTWTLGNLDQVTAEAGSYALQLIATDSGITDVAGNALVASAGNGWSADTTPPTLSVGPVVHPNPRHNSISQLTFEFSEVVSPFEWSDLVLRRDGGVNLLTAANTPTTSDSVTWILPGLTTLTAAEGTYTLSLTATGSGIVDNAGNELVGDLLLVWDVDATPPAVAIEAVVPDPRNAAIDEIVLAFDEPVIGVDMSDLTLTIDGGADLLTGVQTLTTRDQMNWTLGNLAAATGAHGHYQLTLTSGGSDIVDLASNPLAAGAVETWQVDLVPPSVGISPVGPGPHPDSIDQFTITFSEPIVNFGLDDLTLTRDGGANLLAGGETLTSGDDITWILSGLSVVTGTTGDFMLAVDAGGSDVKDPAENPLSGGASVAWRQDLDAPTVELTKVDPDPRMTAVDTMEIIFSEPVSDFGLEDLTLLRNGETLALPGVATLATSDQTTWTLNNLVTLTGIPGRYGLALKAFDSGIHDEAGNLLPSGTTESWVVPHVRLDITLTDEPSVGYDPDTGEIDTLPDNLEWMDEWTDFYVELWVCAADTQDVAVLRAQFDLLYHTEYFSATSVEYGPAFTLNQTDHINDPTGRIETLGATTSRTDVGDDHPALLARVYFEPTEDDTGLDQETTGHHVLPTVDLGLAIGDAQAQLTDLGPAGVQLATIPDTELWPVIYDLDDDQQIGFSDFSYFASGFLQVVGNGAPTHVWGSDFDHSGGVGFPDFSFFAPNFLRDWSSGLPVDYPDNFPADWRPDALRLASSSAPPVSATELTTSQLVPLFNEAAQRLETAVGREISNEIAGISVQIVDLPGNLLGREMGGNVIQLDWNAAGYGWFVDHTPWDDAESAIRGSSCEPVMSPHDPGLRRVDLLTVFMHELGHALGLDHTATGLMSDSLPLGTRRLPAGDPDDWFVDDGLNQLLSPAELRPDLIDKVFAA